MLFVPSPYRTGQDFDVTEYEAMGMDRWDSERSLAQTVSSFESGSASSTASQAPQSSPPSPPPSPSAPELVEVERREPSSSPQLRLIKRKAPEV